MDAMVASGTARQLMSGISNPVQLHNAGLDERDGEIFAHGWLDIESMTRLKVDAEYQREVLEKLGRGQRKLNQAINEGARFPDIMVGMRGQNYDTKGHSMILLDPCFIVDGLQRVSALKVFAEQNPEAAKNLRIGAEVRFNTTRETEKKLFVDLNTSRVPVSANVILRNMRGSKNPAITTIYGLSSTDKDFPLFQRVTWTQRAARGDLLTALIVARAAHNLHGFVKGVSPKGTFERAAPIVSQLNVVASEIGLNVFRDNVKGFFSVVDEAWGLKNVEYTSAAPQLRGNFLMALARVMSDHADFWEKNRLAVGLSTKRKLAAFPLQDPEISRLAGAGSLTLPILYNYLVDHLNKGKKLYRLRKREE